jgi:DNA polymerase-4
VKFLAKLASEAAKPRAGESGPTPGSGVVVVDPSAESEFLHPMPVQALWGVGPATLTRLQRLGIRTVGQLAETPVAAVVAALGRAQGAHLHALANCVDPRPVVPDQPVKSVSHEETFPRDLTDRAALEVELLRMADAVASRLRQAGIAGRTVVLKVRFGDFRSVTRSSTLAEATDSAHEIATVGRRLFAELDPSQGVRLLGIGVSQLGSMTARQLSLDDLAPGGDSGRSRAEAAIDEVRARFGPRSVGPASLMGADGLRIARRGAQQWGPTRTDGTPEDPDDGP